MGFLVLLTRLWHVEYRLAVWSFVCIVSFYHLILGIGITRKSRFWFRHFRGYLRLIYFAFPIGTLLSRYTIRYIDEKDIERLTK